MSNAMTTGSQTKDLAQYLKSPAVVASIKQGCSKHVTAERLVRVACAAIMRQPLLAQCSKESLYLALTNCGQLGLEPNLIGSAYLIPYYSSKNRCYEAQFIPGYRGLIELARRSGQIQQIAAYVVYEKDQFDYEVGSRPKHKPFEGDEPGEIRAAWAVCVFKDGGEQVEVIWRRDINKIRDNSQSYKLYTSGKLSTCPWVEHYAEMAKKTAIRRLCKYLPLTIELVQAIECDTADEVSDLPHIDIKAEAVGQETIEPESGKVAADPQPTAAEAVKEQIRKAQEGK